MFVEHLSFIKPYNIFRLVYPQFTWLQCGTCTVVRSIQSNAGREHNHWSPFCEHRFSKWVIMSIIKCWVKVRTLSQTSTVQLLTWWRHEMETFSALLAICAGNSPVPGEFPTQRPVTRSLDVFFDLRPNKRLSKQTWGWWFETPSCSLWRHCNEFGNGWLIPSHILLDMWLVVHAEQLYAYTQKRQCV